MNYQIVMSSDKFNVLKKILILIILSWFVNIGQATIITTTYEKLNYEINTDTNEATCTGASSVINDMVIPDYVEYNGVKYPVTVIGDYAFDGCSGFTGSLTIPNSVITIGEHAFDGCSGFDGSLTLGNSLTEIEDWAFNECSNLKGDLIIPNSVIRIGDSAFRRCIGFEGTLKIGESVEIIGHNAFIECNGLKGDLIIPESVVTIGNGAFHNCNSFSGSLIIGNSVTSIGSEVFGYCGFNGTLSLGNSVSEIGWGSFYGIKFKDVLSLNTTPPQCEGDPFSNINQMPLYVPIASVGLYKEADVWKDFLSVKGLDVWGEVTSITITPDKVDLLVGNTKSLSLQITPAEVETGITWFSGDPSVAEVSNNGVVKAISEGLAIIYARADNGVTGMATVKVVNDEVTSVTITPDDLVLEIDESTLLTVELTPEFAETTITWSSRDPMIAEVNPDGLVTGVGKGATFIYARCENGVTGIATVTVVDSKEVSSVTIVPGSLDMLTGEEEQLEAVVKPATASPAITWLSSNTDVAEVSEYGLVTAISPGVAIIYALTDNGMTGLATVRVESNEVVSVTIDPDILTLEIDETGYLSAYVEPAGATGELIWSSSDPQIATVDEYGMVKAIGAGYTFIYAASGNGVTGIAIVKVIDPNADDSNPDFGYGDNGVYVSAIRIREGDSLGLFAERPTGYENNDWSYDWYLNDTLEAEGKYVLVPAGKAIGWKGDVMTTSAENYEVDITNLSGDEVILGLPTVTVYARPLTPVELSRKGDGRSRTLIAMSQFSDTELSKLGYSFVFGYTDDGGVNHVISNGRLRYCETPKEIYDNEKNRFWVYTTWTFPDGAVITSGLRYLDGTLNESFNRSDFNETRSGDIEAIEADSEIRIFTFDGHYVGKDTERLAPGIYIISERKGKQNFTRKIIKR